jgi:hypothetical protein
MNERIKELAEQCYEDFQTLTSSKYLVFNKEKFAELIVQECAKIADQAEPYKATDLILKHFGVEKSRSQKLKEAGFTRRYKTWTKEKDDEI